MTKKQKLELTWIGKENRPKLESCILLEDPEKSNHAAHRMSSSEAKMMLNRLVKEVNARNDKVVITKNGSPAAVLMSRDKFEGLKETSVIRSDTALMREIRKGLRDRKQKHARLYTLKELFR
jgi:prevent-host-death family protein